jgi:hypothetical protein
MLANNVIIGCSVCEWLICCHIQLANNAVLDFPGCEWLLCLISLSLLTMPILNSSASEWMLGFLLCFKPANDTYS